jgi:phosphopentomutase
MKRFVVIVLDGFGIGAMDDVPASRPRDIGSNTCRHIFERVAALRLPTLERLGLGNALLASEQAGGTEAPLPPTLRAAPEACFGFHRLAHFGADTFWGHQELMGTKPRAPETAPFSTSLPAVRAALEKAGHKVRFYAGTDAAPESPGILVVDEAVTVGDNLETDLGNNYNVTAALDILPFEKVREIGELVRSLVSASRVIVFGGAKVGLADLLAAFESRSGHAGVNAPASGVYREGYQVVHLGFGVDPKTQIPNRLDAAGVPSVLIGKVADIVENPNGRLVPGVDTEEVLRVAADTLRTLDRGFVCVNVQETDLAGHREDPGLYARRLVLADRGIADIIGLLGPEDLLVVTADHGNDPTIGHPQHTREKTPILVHGAAAAPGFIGERLSLADTGATAAEFFGAAPPQFGASYLNRITSIKETAIKETAPWSAQTS